MTFVQRLVIFLEPVNIRKPVVEGTKNQGFSLTTNNYKTTLYSLYKPVTMVHSFRKEKESWILLIFIEDKLYAIAQTG